MKSIVDVGFCAEEFANCRILVIGDLMLDEYIWGHIERISPEAPVPILKAARKDFTLGGAGNVAKNLRALGVQVSLVGVVGEDETGEQVKAALDLLGVDRSGVLGERRRKSTRKVRLMSEEHGQQVFRLDEETNEPVCEQAEGRIVSLIREMAGENELIICSDYQKGVLTERVLSAAFMASRAAGRKTIVGPKDPSYRRYLGADMLMLNLRELAQFVATPPDGNMWLTNSALDVMQHLGLEVLVVTRGKDGMTLFEQRQQRTKRVNIPTSAKSVYDVTGAGDTALAVFSAAVACGGEPELAAQLANVASGIVVGRRGTATASAQEIRGALESVIGRSTEVEWTHDATTQEQEKALRAN
jgi:rfaE bifunctional protein kinase chain/domain